MPRAVDYFSLLAADILARLYTLFPTPTDWKASDLGIQAIDPDEDSNRLTEIWADTVRWLRDEGYIRFRAEERISEEPIFSGVILTEKGLAKLSTPLNTSPGKNIADALIATIGDITTEASQQKIRKYIEQIIVEPK